MSYDYDDVAIHGSQLAQSIEQVHLCGDIEVQGWLIEEQHGGLLREGGSLRCAMRWELGERALCDNF